VRDRQFSSLNSNSNKPCEQRYQKHAVVFYFHNNEPRLTASLPDWNEAGTPNFSSDWKRMARLKKGLLRWKQPVYLEDSPCES
jgi:hypothetical protein